MLSVASVTPVFSFVVVHDDMILMFFCPCLCLMPVLFQDTSGGRLLVLFMF
jgi:hypothetical protein